MKQKIILAGESAIFAQYDPLTSIAAWQQESGKFRQKFMQELGDYNALNRTLEKSCINWGKYVIKIINQYNRAEWFKKEHGVEIDKKLAEEFKIISKDYQSESEYIIPMSTPARPIDATQGGNKRAPKTKKETVAEKAIVAIEATPPATPPPTTEVPKRKLVLKLKSSVPAPAPEKRRLKLVLKNQPSQ